MYTVIRTIVYLFLISLTGCATKHMSTEEEKMLRAAEKMHQEGSLATAINMYKQILDKTTDKLPILLLLAKAYSDNNELELAKKTYESALLLDKGYLAKKGLARCYVMAGKPELALALYSEALSSAADGDLYTGMGISYSLLGNHAKAQEYFKKACQEKPDNTEYVSNLALSLGNDGKTKEALALLEPLASTSYASEKLKNNLAILYGLDDQPEKARRLFMQTVGSIGADMNLQSLQQIPTHPIHLDQPAIEGGL